jgi:hypothetical protein
MSSLNYKSAIGCALCLSLIVGCAHPRAESNSADTDEYFDQIKQALELERHADLHVFYNYVDDFQLHSDRGPSLANITADELAGAAAKMETGRSLAVVTLGKLLSYQYPAERLREDTYRIEAALKTAGYKQVFFHRASAFGPFPYRASD